MKTAIENIDSIEIIESLLQGIVKESTNRYLIRKIAYIQSYTDKLGCCGQNERDESLTAIYNLFDDIAIEARQVADRVMTAIKKIEEIEKEN